ncbi:hypothetical protein [Streptomyces luteireticuli]|uniref:hypothetical protein n=1 Tax=Streptomyces luteireticuli TaxID=173858 RepID=UPI003556C043
MPNPLDHLAARIVALEQRLTALSRASRLSYSSIEDGAVEVYDGHGSLRAVIGQQTDGSSAVNIVNGRAPDRPSAPQVEPALGSIVVTWDGTWNGGSILRLDFARTEVHVSPVAGFEPSPATLFSTIESPRGGTVSIPCDRQMWVRLIARNTSGAASTPSETASAVPAPLADKLPAGSITSTHIKAGSIGADQLALGTTGNLLPDPSFETGYVRRLLADAGSTAIVVEPGGNASANCLRITAGSVNGISFDAFPCTPGDRFWLAADYRCSPDWTGNSPAISLRWYDANGNRLGDGQVSTASALKDGLWHRISNTVQAPSGCARASVRIEATGSSGTAWIDNAECRVVLSSATGGARGEVSPDGVRLYGADGEVAVSLTTGTPNFLTLSTDGVAVASISQEGAAGFQNLSVADGLIWRGDTLETHIAWLPQGLVAINHQTSSIAGGNSEVGYVELAFTADPTRMYRVVLDAHAIPSAAGGEIQLRIRDSGEDAPDIRSPQIQSAVYPLIQSAWQRVRLEYVSNFSEGTHRLLSTFLTKNTPSGATASLVGGPAYPAAMYVEDVGPLTPDTGQFNTGGGGTQKPPPRRYVKTYSCTWSGSYSNRGAYNGYFGNKCLQGYYSSANGIQSSLIGFPAGVASDVSGAKIISVEVYLYFDHWFNNSGGRAVIKPHGHGSRPGVFSADSSSMAVDWARNQGKWVNVTQIFDPSRFRGIALDPNSTSPTYYGVAHGVGQDNAPQLRVSYLK